jgi:NitT/TauT family transport system ATP-binding protein
MSRAPGRITEEIAVPLAFPRRHDLRYEPEFATVAGRVSHALRAGST